MPAQHPPTPRSAAEQRGRFFNTGNAFNVVNPAVPDHSFVSEPQRALDPAIPTGLIACDLSSILGCDFPATTPLVLARYARIRARASCVTDFAASGVIAYVIVGSGETTCGNERIVWEAGDLFILPGGVAAEHTASGSDAIVWLVINEPQLALEHLRPPALAQAPTDLVHYRADEIARQSNLLYEIGRGEEIAGSALVFSAARQQATRNILPTFIVQDGGIYYHTRAIGFEFVEQPT
jgi:hypothetical protein